MQQPSSISHELFSFAVIALDKVFNLVAVMKNMINPNL